MDFISSYCSLKQVTEEVVEEDCFRLKTYLVIDRSEVSDRWLLFKHDGEGNEVCLDVDESSLASSVLVPSCRWWAWVRIALVSVRVHGWDNGRCRTGDSVELFNGSSVRSIERTNPGNESSYCCENSPRECGWFPWFSNGRSLTQRQWGWHQSCNEQSYRKIHCYFDCSVAIASRGKERERSCWSTLTVNDARYRYLSSLNFLVDCLLLFDVFRDTLEIICRFVEPIFRI